MLEEFDGFESNEDFGVELKDNEDDDAVHSHVAGEGGFRTKLPSAREISTTKHSLVPDMLNGYPTRTT